jgi:hypothetical protein
MSEDADGPDAAEHRQMKTRWEASGASEFIIVAEI